MIVVDTIAAFRKELDAARSRGDGVGFVPTMGYLHAGHASLVETAASESPCVAASIFVNPLQFGPTEDLAAYPRDLDRDLAMLDALGTTVVFTPDVTEMYPAGAPATTITVDGVSARFEGAHRPTHFAGVATVVAKLFAITGACRAYFGEKDWQQLAVVRRMVSDLSLPVDVVGCPTVREDDGLAMSSRNVYLTAHERAAAPVLHRALIAGRDAIHAGERDPHAVRELLAHAVATEPVVCIDYADVVDARTLEAVAPLVGELRLLIAARLGKARLIDNEGAHV